MDMTQLEDTYALSTNSLTFHMFNILAPWKGAFCHAEPSIPDEHRDQTLNSEK